MQGRASKGKLVRTMLDKILFMVEGVLFFDDLMALDPNCLIRF